MRRYQGWLFVVTIALLAWGCNKTEQPAQENAASVVKNETPEKNTSAPLDANPSPQLEGPKLTVYQFLDACRTGNDEKANSLLSAIAREKTAEMDYRLRPTASDTARFSIDNVDYVGEDGARVAMTWTDVDDQGKDASAKAVWVLRKEAEGWRVVGTAAIFFPGEDPVLLNFENPAEVKRSSMKSATG